MGPYVLNAVLSFAQRRGRIHADPIKCLHQHTTVLPIVYGQVRHSVRPQARCMGHANICGTLGQLVRNLRLSEATSPGASSCDYLIHYFCEIDIGMSKPLIGVCIHHHVWRKRSWMVGEGSVGKMFSLHHADQPPTPLVDGTAIDSYSCLKCGRGRHPTGWITIGLRADSTKINSPKPKSILVSVPILSFSGHLLFILFVQIYMLLLDCTTSSRLLLFRFYYFPFPPPVPRAATSVANWPHALDSSLPRGVLTKVGHPPCVRT